MLRTTSFLGRHVQGVSRLMSTKLPKISDMGVSKGVPSSGDSFVLPSKKMGSDQIRNQMLGNVSSMSDIKITKEKLCEFIEHFPHLELDQKSYIENFFKKQEISQ